MSVGFYPGRWARNLVSGGLFDSTKLNVGTPTASLNINRDGSIAQTAGGGGTGGVTSGSFSAQWSRFIATAMGDAFWVLCQTDSGGFNVGDTPDTWLALTSNRSFGVSRSTLGSSSAGGTIKIATDSGGSNVVGSFSFIVRATVTSA